MAQFVVQNKFVGQPQPIVFSSQVLQQSPVQVVPNRFQEQTNSLLKKEDSRARKLRTFLFWAPFLFFLVLLVFSSVIYGLRFEKSNNTTPSAAKTLVNFGDSLDNKEKFPIVDIQVVKKYKSGTSGPKSTCKDDMDAKVKGREHYHEHVFNTFAQVRDGCVCQVKKYTNTVLVYHDLDYCTDNSNQQCRRVRDRPATDEKYLMGDLWCVRRANDVYWLRKEETCTDRKDRFNKDMMSCGDYLCVTKDHDSVFDKCPVDNVRIEENAYKKVTDEEERTFNDVDFTGKQKLVYTQSKTGSNRPVMNLVTTISHPRCLADDLQRPLRKSQNYFKFQEPRETGCWPYGAHVQQSSKNLEKTATYLQSYVNVLTQKAYYEKNDILTNDIGGYFESLIRDEDKIQFFSEVRPQVQNSNECRDSQIQYISYKARSLINVLSYVEQYSFAFIITSSFGFVLATVFLIFRHKNLVNSTTQFYLHAYTLLNAVALFIYPLYFWQKLYRFETRNIESNLQFQQENDCYSYQGQHEASTHLYGLIRLINNEINGLTTFLFVFDIVYLVAVFASAFLRKRQALSICEPVKGEQYYYEN